MGSTGPTEVTAEVERKYDVDRATILPTLAGVDGIARVGQPVEHLLEAVYYDTAGLDLARSRITLRRRTGGADAGWHLKLPGADDLRTEVRLPLDAPDAPTAVPEALLEPVRTVVRDRPLGPVAVLRSRRREQDLLDDRGRVVAHLCDDEVEAESPAGPRGTERWREWEVELTGDDTGLLDTVEERLLEAGAAPAGHSSKLRRALGDRLPRTATPPPGPDGRRWSKASTADVVRAYLGEHRAALHHHDPGVREGDPESVHKMRVAARRLRSALTTYRPVLGRDVADPLRAELRWLGLALSGARDTHVLRSRLSGVLDAEPPELVVGPVVARLEQELGSTERDGQQCAVQALRSTRYYRLLDALDAVVDSDRGEPGDRGDPGHAESAGRAATEVPALVRRDWRRLRRAVEEVGRAADDDAHDRALHEARKKAKRLRYAAESAATVRPREAAALASAAEAVQEALGEHHDTVVARARLRSVAMTAHLSGENAFTFGRLHALEQWRAARAEQAFDAAWESLSRRRLRHWLRHPPH
jgi:CHAD domain-containing protein